MSITAEKVAKIIDGPPFSVGEATLAHLSADDRQSWVQRKNHALAKAEAILSLLQQGEPDSPHSSSRQAALEEVEAAERDLISFYDNPKVIGYRNPESLRRWLEAKMRPAFERVRSALAATPPAEGEGK